MGLSSLEDFGTLVSAAQMLGALNWTCLTGDETVALRNGRKDQAVLTGILMPWLEANNRIDVKGSRYPFSKANISEAVRQLVDIPPHGLVKTNEEIYHLLTLGASLEQTVRGDRKGHTLKYIDWRHPEKNHYHFTFDFGLEPLRSYDVSHIDAVLFVNGIPLVAIECQANSRGPGGSTINDAINRLIDYQRVEKIPQLFHYIQLLFATSENETRYATVGTSFKFWSKWRDEGDNHTAIHSAANQPLSTSLQSCLMRAGEAIHLAPDALVRTIQMHRGHGSVTTTEQDATLWSMLRHGCLLEFVYQFVVFDGGVRKVARYQQYFAVKAAVKKVATLRDGRRAGGVIWHTTGSGKSLTMVMMAKALALSPHVTSPHIVLVTDRVDLEDQLWRTFGACGKTAVRAKTGEHLVRLIREGRTSLITTVIDKFCNVVTKHTLWNDSPDIFVVVDEGHRSNYGVLADRMRNVFPNACYLGFTGTPLQLKEKNTAQKFGGFIHCYSMQQAVLDNAIVPLMYEGRMVPLVQQADAIQAWFERLADNLSGAQKKKLMQRFAVKDVVNAATQRIAAIALDISTHYRAHYKGTGLKAQLATNSRTEALQYQTCINDYGLISAEVIMSQPSICEGQGDYSAEQDTRLFWKEMMTRFGSEEEYVRQIKASFAREDGCDLLIVVDKLLTGFDEPRNTVLYIDKPLKGHNLLQAIARVNRLFPGKSFGLLVDYRGVLGNLSDAMQRYDALAGFACDDADFHGAIIDIRQKIDDLKLLHAALWAVFHAVEDPHNMESMARYLRPDGKRREFYQAFSRFSRVLSIALATDHFQQSVSADQINIYKDDLAMFSRLRASVRHRYSETIDVHEDDRQLRRVMDFHLHAKAIIPVTKMTSIFDIEAFDREVDTQECGVARADMIASRVKVAIDCKMAENEVFYQKFSYLVQRAIDAFYAGRISEAEYVNRQQRYLNTIRRGHELDLPEELEGHQEAQALFDLLSTLALMRFSTRAPNSNSSTTSLLHLPDTNLRDDTGAYDVGTVPLTKHQIAQISLDIESIIDSRKIRDWPLMEDVVKDMQNAVDDYLFDVRDRCSVDLKTHDMDTILDHCITIARNRGQANT